MNIRIPDTLPTMSAAAQTWPDRIRRTSSRTRLIGGIAAIAIAAFIAWRIFGGPAVHERPAPPVQVTRVEAKDVAIVEHTIGTVLANATVQLTARIQGQIVSTNFVEGQLVQKGDLLFQIDPRPYRAAYESAIASLASTKAKADRDARLLAANAVAPQDADDAKAAYLEAKANAETARLNLEYTSIRSPIDGKTGPILIQPGNQVMASAGTGSSASAPTAASSTLVVITQVQPVKISFSLPQADLSRIQDRQHSNGLSASIDNHAADGTHIDVPIDFVSNAIDNNTGTIELRATYANADSRLVPGQLVDVGVTLNAIKGAIVVPHDAVNLGPTSRFVYIVKDGKAEMHEVKVLYDGGSEVAIQSDVKPGDIVITDGQLRVLPGKPVNVLSSRSGSKPATP
jgi:multidrug efflux system membrane fusion protein